MSGLRNMKFTSININDLDYDQFTVDSPEVNEELAGEIGVEFELGVADKNLPDNLAAFRFQTENASMETPEISIWRGREKISHFAGAFGGPISELQAHRKMRTYYDELKQIRPDLVEDRYVATPGASPCVLFLLYPGYTNLAYNDKTVHLGVIHSIIVGVQFMASC